MFEELESFRVLGLSDKTLEALSEKGFSEPTDIQRECIPLLLENKLDVIGQARTGTGKTAAFALPILETIDEKDKSTQALILAPTRELAMQVASEIDSLKGKREISVDAIYGGTSYENQFKKLKKGLQIVVGTPGRIQDHLDRGTLDISKISFAVLDEADEMLDMGFVEDIEKILANSPKDKRMLLFSATMPDPILRLAENFMRDYTVVRIKKQESEEVLTEQYYYDLRESDKMEALCRIIDYSDDFYGIVFCKTKVQCEEIGRKLSERGYNAEALHGDLSQKQREIILQNLRDHKIKILVATDVAARGIDVQELTHVINFTIPQDPEVYIHRIGRTGRAGKKGTAITFVTPSEARKFGFIKRISRMSIEKGTLPSSNDIILKKKERILDKVRASFKEQAIEYEEIAAKLLEEEDSFVIVKALLKLLYKNELDKSQYHTIRSLEKPQDKKKKSKDDKAIDDGGTTRLFIAMGRKDGLTKRLLANMLIERCRVRDEDIQNIEVMDEFSFINVPSMYADLIINAFKTRGEKGKPLIVKAKAEKESKKPIKISKKSNTQTSIRRSRRKWEDDIQPYGRDSRDDDDDFDIKRSLPPKKKPHGKYNINKKVKKH
ncbi:DEAD/DEAH box helicase [Bullifex porci]|uniref:DEAD/DEAH box helicase n=1 Tax=Bullifex porci TaxID=2606638 RepID=UPI0023F289CC|nr:DEAD/DEAH box helicase [Bullifex porci]MDD7255755.1 DEAD/DEAH box helicase [Bullifex porci]MDY2741459.1 DEAD/DEAH box helicase [Bullifex porci]